MSRLKSKAMSKELKSEGELLIPVQYCFLFLINQVHYFFYFFLPSNFHYNYYVLCVLIFSNHTFDILYLCINRINISAIG